MACPCKREHVFIGVDFGTTRSGAVATYADVCIEHNYFHVKREVRVKKFLTRFVSQGHTIEMVVPDQNDPNVSGVRNAKLEILFSGGPEWFLKTGDFSQIKAWVELDWQRAGDAGLPAEYFGSAVKKLYELAWEELGMKNIAKECITTVVTFPLLTKAIKATLGRGLVYSNISSRCPDVQVSEESHAALAGLLREYPDIGRDALARHESIIVADCGGITLDIAAFRTFDPNCGGAPAAASISRLGGGLWIDRNFEELVDKKLDQLKAQISKGGKVDDEEADDVKSDLIREWHTSIKEQALFRVGESHEFALQGMMASIDRADMESVLMPECSKIADAIFEVADQERKENGGRPLVFLTGGLGCSQAVRELVPRMLNAKVPKGEPKMLVESTEDPPLLWNAVAMGAAHCFDRTIPVHRSTWRPFTETPESDEMMS